MTTDLRVKICGITRREDAWAAAEAGAAYLGFIFAQSPRQVRAELLAPWLDELRERVELVGVFRDQPLAFVRETVHFLDLDLVQLHGSESGKDWLELPVRVIAARPVGADGAAARRFGGGAWAELLDTESEQGGGSGRRFDWSVAEGLARAQRVFLAGGLTPENVAGAVSRVRPFAVDVSSGVERSPGVKDGEKIRAFCAAARRT